MTRSYRKIPLVISPMYELPQIKSDNEPKPSVFSQDTIDSVTELGSVLQKIHNRLLSEGYCIMVDRIINPQGDIVYEKPKKN